MTDNVTDVFGSWLPALAAQQGQQGTTGAKQPRENSSADGLPSKRAKPTRRGGRGRGQSLPQEQIGNVVTMLASLCLQQEDALNRIRLKTSHTLHLAQQGQGAVLKALYNAGTAWQVKKNSGEPVQALRVVLFGLLLAETQARIQLFSKDDAAVKAAQANHILDKDKRFVYQKWDAQASKLVTDPDKKGLTLEEVMAILTELRKLSNDQTITKFNASRRLRKEPDNDEKAVFTVEVAMRSPPANRIQGLLDQMTDNAAWGLVAACAVETTQPQAPRASQRHPEGPGGRLDGQVQPKKCPTSLPYHCPSSCCLTKNAKSQQYLLYQLPDIYHPLAGTATGRHHCPRSVAASSGPRDMDPGKCAPIHYAGMAPTGSTA